MEISIINVLGLSEPALTMLQDNLESYQVYPELKIYNNLDKKTLLPYVNPNFKINVVTSINELDLQNPFFLGVNKPENKIKIQDSLKVDKEKFLTIINKTASVSSTTTIGNGVHINSMVSIASFSIINDFVSINRNASVGHHTEIGGFTTVNPGANIAGFVKIGIGCLIGMGVNIIDGVEIGANSIIGAGSVVTKNIPENVIAYGNPCKIIRTNET